MRPDDYHYEAALERQVTEYAWMPREDKQLLERLKKERDDRASEFETLKVDNTKLRARIDEMEHEADLTGAYINAANKTVDDLQQQARRNAETVRELRGSVFKLNREVAGRDEQIALLRADLEYPVSKTDDPEDDDLETELADANAEIEELEAELAAAKEALDELKAGITRVLAQTIHDIQLG